MTTINEADNYVAPNKEMSKDDKKKDKYQQDMDGFTIAGNSNIKDGVVKERRVTDFMCLILFLVFIGAMAACTLFGFKNGDVDKYIAPLDGNDHFCGIDAGYEDFPKLFLRDL
mgnify:CR=1 FL=1